MTEPLATIRFDISPYSLTFGGQTRYQGRFVFANHQFGFWKVNADTGQVITRVGIGYRQPIFPPPDFGYINGDFNQSCSQIAVSERWIVLDNIAPAIIGGLVAKPSALIFLNDAGCTKWGYVPQVAGYWWNRSARPRIIGDLCYVKNDMNGYDSFNCETRKWVARQATAPPAVEQASIDGATYAIALDGDPWAGGTYKASKFVLTRSGTVTAPPVPPPVETVPPVVTPPVVSPPVTGLPPLTMSIASFFVHIEDLEKRVKALEGK